MVQDDKTNARIRWARLRFQIIGPLLASPPQDGELKARLEELASKTYQHPTRGETLRFGVSTIERWFYHAKDANDPIVALERKVPKHAGLHPGIGVALGAAITRLHREHPTWSYQLHYDNLLTMSRQDATLGAVPSYPTIRRYMKGHGLLRQRRRRPAKPDAAVADDAPDVYAREARSYEHPYVHGLWHLDFHEGSRKVLVQSGEWKSVFLLGVLDDCSRLCCHAQWYLDETTESLVHALCQAILKRGLPRSLMSDNGSAMTSAETVEGLERLSIEHKKTLPYSPQQNGKQESFWGRVEGRLLAMLEGEKQLTLALLNTATQAWAEQEYHRTTHSEIGVTPLERAMSTATVARPSPSTDLLRRAFRMQVSRAQRRGDGTISVEGVRFEVPSRYRTLTRCTVRVARWDMSSVDLVDPRTGGHLATLLPLDKQKNADGQRRAIRWAAARPEPTAVGIAPRLRELMSDYAATGLPPAYLPKHDATEDDEETG
ncbi:MAG TPA: DDE-type integrase/transposase/recombinase [Polyangiales bacterium]|nr:DDE-type integrase/transposase/recombinase [Polyangiales bacterium]